MDGIDNQVIVIFGGSGDLTARKLVPALFDLYCGGFLPKNHVILGVARSEFTDEAYKEKVVFGNEHITSKSNATEKHLKGFSDRIFYQCLLMDQADQYEILKTRLSAMDAKYHTTGNYIFYLATPPSLYEVISSNLAAVGFSNESQGWKRMIVEKPFGTDLKTAKNLNAKLLTCFDEQQIYRIDHYLGKETVQNFLVTRFANSIFEPLWNRNFVHHIEVTSAEKVGVEKRGGYYDQSGALRDMVQNHLLQLVALIAMEPPVKGNAQSIRGEKLKLFQSLRPLTEQDIRQNIMRGQYVSSKVNGVEVAGYREEPGVDPNSNTETFVAMKFFIDNWRWAGVPFYVRTGKKLPTRVTEVVIHFKPNHHHLFIKSKKMINQQNMLVLRIQPNEGILLKFGVKIPGIGFNVDNANMDFLYDDLTDVYVPGPYERLLLDCMQGDATLYASGESVEAAWEFIDPILNMWQNGPKIKMYGYPAGTWGPENADDLVEGENFTWRYPCANLTNDGIYCEL